MTMTATKIKWTAKNCAMNLLARREHSSRELKNKLLKREFATEQIEEAVTTLQQEGLQSDARFAEAYVHMRTHRGYGPYRIRMELEERGISDQLIGQYLQEQDVAWQQCLVDAWRKKFRGRYPSEAAEYKKQMDFLQYRGFSLKQINMLLRKKLDE